MKAKKRHSVLLNALQFPVSIETSITADLELNSQHETLVEKLEKSIRFIQSISSSPNPDTFLIFTFISSTEFFVNEKGFEASDPTGIDGLLALLLTLESSALTAFQFNWVIVEQKDVELLNDNSSKSIWKEAFPFINFIFVTPDSLNSFSIPNNLLLPQLGQLQLERSDCFFHEKISENSKFIGSCRRGQIDGFIAADPFRILKFPPLSTKLLGQFNQDSDVLVFRTEIESNVALLVVDVLNSSLGFIDSVFVRMVNDQFTTKLDPKSSISAAIPASNKWLNKSISDWTSEENSMDETSIKSNNKLKLKKLILLSLRGIGIKKSDKQFMNTWKHLYCGCIFSLRKELNTIELDQNDLLKTIKENIKFLNL